MTKVLDIDDARGMRHCETTALGVLLRHQGNVRRLVRGQENRLPESAAMQLLGKTIHVLALALWFGAAVFFTFVPSLAAGRPPLGVGMPNEWTTLGAGSQDVPPSVERAR